MPVKVWAYLNDELMEIQGGENPQIIEGQGELVFEFPADASFDHDMEVRYVLEEVDESEVEASGESDAADAEDEDEAEE